MNVKENERSQKCSYEAPSFEVAMVIEEFFIAASADKPNTGQHYSAEDEQTLE